MALIKLKVKTKNQMYPIIIGSGVSNKLYKFLKENSINFNQCLIIADNRVPKKMIKKILISLQKKQTTIHYFQASELNKNQNSVNKILSILLKKKF